MLCEPSMAIYNSTIVPLLGSQEKICCASYYFIYKAIPVSEKYIYYTLIRMPKIVLVLQPKYAYVAR